METPKRSSDDNPSDRSSLDENPILPDIRGICAKARRESDTVRAFAMLSEMSMAALTDEAHRKAISAEDARDIVETFEGLGVKIAMAGRSADAAICYAVTARIATGFPDLEMKVVPALNRALEYSDFIDMERDAYLALEMGLAYAFFGANRPQFKPRNEPERMKFYEMGLAASIIRTERAGEPPAPLDVESLFDACMNAGQMHAAAGRFENATYWFIQGAHLAEKISDDDKGFSMWYNAGLSNDKSKADNLPEQTRCFLEALKLLPNTWKPDRSTDEETFEQRQGILREMGFFFFSERLVSANPALQENGVKCFLQALEDVKRAKREEQFYPISAEMRRRLGTFFLDTDRPDYAHRYLRDAVATWKNGISQTWKNETSQQPPYIREGLAETLNQLGSALESLAGKEQTDERELHLREAQGFFKESRGIYRDLFAITPLSDLQARATYHLRAQTLARNEGRVAGSQGHWDDTVSILESAVRFEGMMPKFSYCETFDGIKQDLAHARSKVRGTNDEQSRPIKNVHSSEEHSRKATPN